MAAFEFKDAYFRQRKDAFEASVAATLHRDIAPIAVANVRAFFDRRHKFIRIDAKIAASCSDKCAAVASVKIYGKHIPCIT